MELKAIDSIHNYFENAYWIASPTPKKRCEQFLHLQQSNRSLSHFVPDG